MLEFETDEAKAATESNADTNDDIIPVEGEGEDWYTTYQRLLIHGFTVLKTNPDTNTNTTSDNETTMNNKDVLVKTKDVADAIAVPNAIAMADDTTPQRQPAGDLHYGARGRLWHHYFNSNINLPWTRLRLALPP